MDPRVWTAARGPPWPAVVSLLSSLKSASTAATVQWPGAGRALPQPRRKGDQKQCRSPRASTRLLRVPGLSGPQSPGPPPPHISSRVLIRPGDQSAECARAFAGRVPSRQRRALWGAGSSPPKQGAHHHKGRRTRRPGPPGAEPHARLSLCFRTQRLPLWLRWERIRLQCGRPVFHPWVGKIPWRRERLRTPVF